MQTGGANKQYFYVIDLPNNKQHKITSSYLNDTYAPCFINGDSKQILVGDWKGKMEIYDIETQQSIRKLSIDVERSLISATASIHNILAIASREDKKLRLFDIRNWECFYEESFDTHPRSLTLTNDLKFVCFSGDSGDMCFVLQID